MNGVEVLKRMIGTGEQFLLTLADDLREHPLAPPVEGGNHALWCVGHVAYADRAVLQMAFADENPLAHWKQMFGAGSQPTTDASACPTLAEVIDQFKQSRAAVLAKLEALTDADLDRPAVQVPEGREQMFGTVGACLCALALHPMHHRGQLADIRRMLARQPLLA